MEEAALIDGDALAEVIIPIKFHCGFAA